MFAAFDTSIRLQAKTASRALRSRGVSPLTFGLALGAVQLTVLVFLFVRVWIVDGAAHGLGEAMSLTTLAAGYLVFMALATRKVFKCLDLADPHARRRSLARLFVSRRKDEMFGRLFSVFIALGAISALPDVIVGGPGLHAQAGSILVLTVVDAARQYWFC